MKCIYIIPYIFIFCTSCSNNLKFELTDQGDPFGYSRRHDDLVPSYCTIYLVTNYTEEKDSSLMKFVQTEFKKANYNYDSLMYVSFSFYRKTFCTKKFLSQNPLGNVAIGDPELGCFDDRINGYYYERISKDANKWIFSDYLNETTDTIEITFCNRVASH